MTQTNESIEWVKSSRGGMMPFVDKRYLFKYNTMNQTGTRWYKCVSNDGRNKCSAILIVQRDGTYEHREGPFGHNHWDTHEDRVRKMKISHNLKKASQENDTKRLNMVYRDVINKYVIDTPLTTIQMQRSIPSFMSARSKMANARAAVRFVLPTTPDTLGQYEISISSSV